jgi:hypothetical protein
MLRGLEAVLGAVLAGALLCLAFGVPAPGLLHGVTAASLWLWGTAAAMENLPLLGGTSDLRIVLEALLVAGLVAKIPAGRWRPLVHGLAVPGLIGVIGALLFGVGLGGGWAGVVLIALAVPALGGPSDVEEPPRVAVGGAFFLGWGALFALHALYVSGPGIQPAPVADRGVVGALQDLLTALPGGAALDPLLSVIGAIAAVFASRALFSQGLPRWPRLIEGPAQWLLAGAHLVVVVGLSASGPWLAGVWRCPEPPSFVTPLDREPGTFQLAVVGDQLWANDREGRHTRRFALSDGAVLPPVDWETHVEDSWPEELIPQAEGAWVALVQGEGDGNVLVPVGADGTPGDPVRLPGCFVASSARLPGGDTLLGCEYAPEFRRLKEDGSLVERFTVPGLGSVEEIRVIQGRVYAVALWGAPWLVEIDLETKKAARSRFAGDFNWGLGWAPGSDLLAVPRFLERRLDLYDRATLEPRGRLAGEFGGRPLVFDARRQTFYVAGTFSGRLRASGLDGSTRTLPVGGLVRTLALHGDTLYLGGRCGVRALDLAAWEAAS